jgi:asparagine synthase (glutamine-hydrolysing)
MCGIAGFYGNLDEQALLCMTRALAHRGPDGEGHAILPGLREPDKVGLGHRRLSLIDLSGGAQPMWSTDRSLAIVFNGEIYNYRELRRELAGEGASFATASDTEVILEGWRLRGPDILPALSGMFAFGLWEAHKQQWILARDRAGIKPLYFAMPQSGCLLFASEIKPLLPLLPEVAVNPVALCDYLLYSWVPGPHTMFKGVSHLRPGHYARWCPGDEDVASIAFVERGAPPSTLNWDDATALLTQKLDRAVDSHLVADVPVGINLSGGLDSSSVLASMVRLREPSSIEAFTIGFGLADDETPFARSMAEHAGVRHHIRTVSHDRLAQDFAGIVRIIEEPIAHPVLQTTLEAASLARETVKAVLIGEGADEILLGYPQYLLLDQPFRHLPRSIIQRLYLAVGCLMPTRGLIRTMLDPSLHLGDTLEVAANRFDHYFRGPDLLEGVQTFEFENPLVANQLMRIDKLTMAKGLEARVPFLDNELTDFVAGLPVSFKRRNGVTKAVLRRAMQDRLPAAVRNRPKTGKGGTQALLPFMNQLVRHGALSDLVSHDSLQKRGWLQADRVLGYLAAGKSTFVRHHPIESRRRAKFAYALAVLEQWAREYLDKAYR